MDKPDEFITGFGHNSSVKQAEAVVKTTLQASILLILFHYTSHVLSEIMQYVVNFEVKSEPLF